jgi:D-2-hydroxyacid dehydrogenase (NADP+)
MKIFLEIGTLKIENYHMLVDHFKDIEFTIDSNMFDVDAVISNPGFVAKQNLDKYPNVKWIHLLTAGYNTVDLDYIKSRSILMTNAKDVFSIQIAEDVFSKILYFNRNLETYVENKKSGLWKHERVLYEIAHSTVGIIGTGSIGTEIAKRMKSFDTTILGYRRKKELNPYFDHIYYDQQGLDTIYKESDYIIIAIPLSQETYQLIDERAFSLMKKSALIINIARGEVIDQDAMIHALSNHQIRGAGLDVTVPEPLPKESPLWSMRQVLITPHNASASPYVNQRLMHSVVSSIDHYIHQCPFDNKIV